MPFRFGCAIRTIELSSTFAHVPVVSAPLTSFTSSPVCHGKASSNLLGKAGKRRRGASRQRVTTFEQRISKSLRTHPNSEPPMHALANPRHSNIFEQQRCDESHQTSSV